MSFKVTVKMSGAGETFDIEVEPDTTVEQMKTLCTV